MDRKDVAILVLVAILVGPLVLTGYTISQQSPGVGGGGAGTIPDWVNEQGGGVESCSWLIYKEGSIYYAKNQQPGSNRGKNQFSDTAFATVLTSIFSAITQGAKLCLGLGVFTLTTGVSYTGHFPLTIEGQAGHLDRFYLSGGGSDPTGTIIVANGIDGFTIGVPGTGPAGGKDGPIFTLRNVLITGQDPSLEPLGDLSQTTGAGVKLVDNVAYALFENVQFHRKQYGIWIAPSTGSEILRVYVNRASFSYNNYGIFHDSFFLAYLVVENIEGYLNRFSLLKANPQYDFAGYRIDDEGSSWDVALGSHDTPIYLTATNDVHLSRVTVIGGKGGSPNIAYALLEIQHAENATSYLSDIILQGTTQRVLYVDGSPTDAYTSRIYGFHLGHNQSSATGYRGVVGDNPAVGIEIANFGKIHLDGGEIYATTIVSKVAASSIIYARNVIGYVTENWGATSVADGGTISHGLAGTPDTVLCTTSVASQFCSVTVLAATTFTVAIKTDTGAAGTTQTIYWYAVFIP